MSGPNSAPEQGLQNYRTPSTFLQAVCRRLALPQGFQWDLACDSHNNVAGAGNGFEFDQGCDALLEDWTALAEPGLTCFLNPPFGLSGAFAAKCASSGARIAALVPVAIGTRWWRQFVHNRAHVVGVGRLVFHKPDGSGPVVGANGKPQAINRDCALLVYNILPSSTPYYLLEEWRDW